MANSAQTPAHLLHSASAPSHNSTTTTSSSGPRPLTTSPRIATPAQAASNHAVTLQKNFLTPTIELTGAGAAADLARQRQQELNFQQVPGTSRNPQNVFGNASPLTSPALQQPMSRPSDAPPRTSAESNQKRSPRSNTHNTQDTPQNYRARFADGPVDPAIARSSRQSRSPRQQNRGQESFYASPEPEDRQTHPPQATAGSNARKRLHSVTPPNTPPTAYGSTYPPISSTAPSNRNASLPNSGANKSPAKKHKCPHCDTEFTRHHNLKSHLLTHSQEKPFACDQCDARFRRLHDLKRHVKLHTGERPHTCEQCGRAFARGDALARHNKGPGGCAGRRESNVGDGDDDMDGEGDEEEDEQDAPVDGSRRKSESNKRARRGSGRLSVSQGQHQSHGRTYSSATGVSTQTPSQAQSQQQPFYPPSTNRPSVGGRSQNLSPPLSHTPTQGFTAPQYQTPSMYAQGSVTDSPRPLSPGQAEPNRAQDVSMGGRSPSISTRMQQQHMIRGSIGGHGTPANSVPAAQQQQHLPSMQIDSRYPSQNGQSLPPPSMSTQAPSGFHSGPPSAGPASGSSHHHSSVGSIREMYNTHAQQQQSQAMSHTTSTSANNEQGLYNVIDGLSTSLKMKGAECDELRAQLQMLQDKHGQAADEYQRMAQENHMLRSQLHSYQGR